MKSIKSSPALPLAKRSALLRWVSNLQLPPATPELISKIRTSPPVRGSNTRRSVKGHYFSAKMRCTQPFESHTCELFSLMMCDWDSTVLEYYPQPMVLKLTYPNLAGGKTGVLHTPDVLVLARDQAYFVEAKTLTDLRELAKAMPNRYVQQPNGTWRCPPGEQAAAKLGLGYKLFIPDLVSAELLRNLNYLEDSRRREFPEPVPALVTKLTGTIKTNQGILLPALLDTVKGLTRDDVNYLIATGRIYVDLKNTLLVDHHNVAIFSDETTAKACQALKAGAGTPVTHGAEPVQLQPAARIRWRGDEHIVVDVNGPVIQLLAPDGKRVILKRSDFELEMLAGEVTGIAPAEAREHAIANLLTLAGPNKVQEAVRRWSIIEPLINDKAQVSRLPKRIRRSVKRWMASYRRSLQSLGNGFVGLIPEARPGHAGSHLDPAVEKLVEQFISERFEDNRAPNLSRVYEQMCAACEKLGLSTPSLKTFSRRARARPQYEQVLKRKGRRGAYSRKPFYFFLDQKTPVHGDRPWEIGHIDHTQLDVEVVCPETGEALGRPWLTLLIDARTRRILSVHVSLFPEAAEASMMVIRECVRRLSRLMQTAVVDNGKSLNNLYFNGVLACFSVSKKCRPAAHPRFGSVCERIFGTVNTQFIHNLRGNTKLTKNVREVTKSVRPDALAVWTLDELRDRLETYCYEIYDTTPHPALGRSPRQEMALLMATHGTRDHTVIPFSRVFTILTLPTTSRGVAKIHPLKGVHINYLDYWHDAFGDAKNAGVEVPVRYDPWDASVAYAFVNGKWEMCISRHVQTFKNWSQRAIEIATNELRAKNKGTQAKKAISAAQLAEFLEQIREREDILDLRRREAASRSKIPHVLSDANSGQDGNPTVSPIDFAKSQAEVTPAASPNDEIISHEITVTEEE